MNNLKDKTVLVIYDSTNANWESWMSAHIPYDANNYESDLIDVALLDDSSAGINTQVALKTNGTYDDVYVMCPISDTGGAVTMNYDTLALCWRKLKTSARGTALITGTAAAAGSDTSHTEFATGASTANDYYNTCLIYTDGTSSGLAQYKIVLDYVGATLIAELGGAAQTATDGDTYTVYPMTNVFVSQDPSFIVSTAYKYDADAVAFDANDMFLTWKHVRSNSSGVYNNPPELIQTGMPSYYMNSLVNNTASGGSTTTLVDSGIGWTVNAFAGDVVYAYDGTGEGQIAKIASNTTDTLTLTNCNNFNEDGEPDYFNNPNGGKAALDVAFANDTRYIIIDAGAAKAFKKESYETFAKAYLFDLTDELHLKKFRDITNKDGFLNDDTELVGSPVVDAKAVKDALCKGYAINKYIWATT